MARNNKFWSRDNYPLTTRNFRVPHNLPDEIINAILVPIVRLADKDETITVDHVKQIWKKKKPANVSTESKPKSVKLSLVAEDVDSANARALGFLAYKLGLQDRPSEIKSSEINDIRESIKAMMK